MVEVAIDEIRVRVGSCDEDACDKKSDNRDGAAQFRKACSGGINGSHVEKASFISSSRPEIWFSSFASQSSLNLASLIVSKLEITVSHSERADCKCVKFSSESLVRSSVSQMSSSSSSEK